MLIKKTSAPSPEEIMIFLTLLISNTKTSHQQMLSLMRGFSYARSALAISLILHQISG